MTNIQATVVGGTPPHEPAPPGVRTRWASPGIGRLTLNRPRALNALSSDMVADLTAALAAWRDDDAVAAVWLEGAGERGLCAGADIRQIYAWVTGGRPDKARRYLRAEYALDAAIAEYPKPVVAIMDGVTMGGGVGLGGHAAIRVVTERSAIAMPETRIGFTPDVGGSWLLARAPGHLGEYLAMGAVTMTGPDAVALGLADVYVPSADLDKLFDACVAGCAKRSVDDDAGGGAGVLAAVRAAARPVPASELLAYRDRVDEWYAAEPDPTISCASPHPTNSPRELPGAPQMPRGAAGAPEPAAEIAGKLDAAARSGDPLAEQWLADLAKLSPTAVSVALAGVRAARGLTTLRAALAQEYALACWFIDTQADLTEGIRAQVIDKDRNPQWRPAALADVPPQTAQQALSYRPAEPLWPTT